MEDKLHGDLQAPDPLADEAADYGGGGDADEAPDYGGENEGVYGAPEHEEPKEVEEKRHDDLQAWDSHWREFVNVIGIQHRSWAEQLSRCSPLKTKWKVCAPMQTGNRSRRRRETFSAKNKMPVL